MASEIEKIRDLGIKALMAAHERYIALGEDGKLKTERTDYKSYLSRRGKAETREAQETVSAEQLRANIQYSILADIEPEAVVVKTLEEDGIPIIIISEELGETVLSSDPKYLGVMDGLDGTGGYLKFGPRDGRQSTMFGIFQGVDPKYEDYLFSGVVEHASKILYYAVRNNGSFAVDIKTKQTNRISPSEEKRFTPTALVSLDEGFDEWAGITVIRDAFISKLEKSRVRFDVPMASSATYIDVASGKAHLGLECTRGNKKQNLETAISYGLLREVGAVIVDIHGRDLGPRRFKRFGHGVNEHIPIVAAANREILADFLDYLKRN